MLRLSTFSDLSVKTKFNFKQIYILAGTILRIEFMISFKWYLHFLQSESLMYVDFDDLTNVNIALG